MQDLTQRAKQYATQGHQRIDQRRKYTGSPYDVHLKAVAALVQTVTDDAEMIAAAWLHDIVEDTPITIEDIESEFGAAVAQLVAELTDGSRPSDGNRAQRKAIDRDKIAQASARAKTIKLADLIDNSQDICKHDPRFAKTFIREAMDLLQVLPEGDENLYRRANKVIAKCAAELGVPEPRPVEEFDPDALRSNSLESTHRRSLRLFAQSFSAKDIAEPLHSCDREATTERLRGFARKQQLQVIGIREKGLISQYMYQASSDQGDKDYRVSPIRKNQIVDWDAPLYDVIRVLTQHSYCFVSALGSITAVISRADIEKPIVRMWLFGIITMIESELANRVEARWGEQGWTKLVPPKRLERAKALQQERLRRNQSCSLISCLQLADKAQVVLQDEAALKEFGFSSKSAVKRVIKEIESLRNNLAHAQDIVSSDWAQIARMAQNFFRHAWNW